MKHLTLCAAILLVLFVSFARAQESDRPLPDRWRGLVLDQSTPEDAARILGQPAKDKTESLNVDPLGAWISKKRKEKVFRTFEYKKVSEAVEKAWLSFLDNKLVSIRLDMKEGTVSPNGLGNIYGVTFTPVIGQADLGLWPADFERNQGKIYPKNFPTIYHLTAVSDKSFLTAMIGNVPSLGGAFAKSMGVPDKPGSFPGKVMFVHLLSRALENRDGADALK